MRVVPSLIKECRARQIIRVLELVVEATVII